MNKMRQKVKKRPRKRYFQLLEIMVAMFILLVCIAPIFHIYVGMHQYRQTIARINRRDQLVSLIHAHITEQLYKRAIALPEIASEFTALPLESLDRELAALSYTYSGQLTMIRPRAGAKEKQEPVKKQLWQLDIIMTDLTYKPNQHTPNPDQNDPSKTTYRYLIYIDRQNG